MRIKLTGVIQRFKESFWTCCLQSRNVNIPLAALSLPYPLHLQLSLLLWASASNPDDPCWKPTLPGHSVSQSMGMSFPSGDSMSQCVPSLPNSLLPQAGHYDQIRWISDVYTPFFDALGVPQTAKRAHRMTLAPHGFIKVVKRTFLIVSHKQCISILCFPIQCTLHMNLLIHSSL